MHVRVLAGVATFSLTDFAEAKFENRNKIVIIDVDQNRFVSIKVFIL